MTRLIFLGPPGAGKGTQAQILADICQLPHISTGAILRTAVGQQTELGKKAEHYMHAGELVPDQLMLGLIRERLLQADAQAGWILDGFPRNVPQAEFLDDLLSELAQPYDCVVNLEVPDEVLLVRLLSRGRKDDTEAVIRHRLQVYRQQTEPLIDFYRQRQQLISVDGNQIMEAVTAELTKLIQPDDIAGAS
ncbi:Adenylate kinase 1 [Halomicronema hongdechloris C2206]|uniref:Adenylate kinase n=1 Tax=Halomicronema hongdechloris C2206 TaxID=1641165 RepID=A0A1Z3HVF6_9CYAN|nr:adenylate kinase [Halomicronema hongdechloris]ASC74298.1 Adenylate kinase 1 [Halomicronema hongdechloris C2206]